MKKMFEIKDSEKKILALTHDEKVIPYLIDGKEIKGEIKVVGISEDGNTRIIDEEKENVGYEDVDMSLDLSGLVDLNGQRHMYMLLDEPVEGVIRLEKQAKQEQDMTSADVDNEEVVLSEKNPIIIDNAEIIPAGEGKRKILSTFNGLEEEEKILLLEKILTSNNQDNQHLNVKKIMEKLTQDMKNEGKTERMFNFELRLKRKCIEVQDTRNGEMRQIKYQIEALIYKKSGQVEAFTAEVDSENVKNFSWLNRATLGLAKEPQGREEKSMFANIIQNCIETVDVPIEITYPTCGWRKISHGQYGYVVAEGIIGTRNSLIHAEDQYSLGVPLIIDDDKQLFEQACGMMDICHNKRASTELFLLHHMSLLNTLFNLAKYPLCFVVGVIGITNSRKTSMVTAMTKLFKRYDNLNSDAEFMSTTCGIEELLGQYGDAVIIIDDFRPGETASEQKMLNKKLTDLVRLYGNRIEKKRMTHFNSGSKDTYFPIRGICVITGELIAGGTSTLSRMFLTEITREDVDNMRLQYYQDRRDILPMHSVAFVCWVTANFSRVVEYIQKRFPELRQQHKFAYGRYAEMYAAYLTTAEILTCYAAEKGYWNSVEQSGFITDVENTIWSELQMMNKRISNRENSTVSLEALEEMMKYSTYRPIPLNNSSSQMRADFYENEDYYFIRTGFLKALVVEYCNKMHEQYIVENKDMLVGQLEAKGVLDIWTDEKGRRHRSRKLPVQNGNAQTYLYIKKKQMQKMLEIED